MTTPLLITGFGPFPKGSTETNPTGYAVMRAHAEGRLPTGTVAAELPVTWGGSFDTFERLVNIHKPQRVISLGVGPIIRRQFFFETTGHNIRHTSYPDAEGIKAQNPKIDDNGPDTILTSGFKQSEILKALALLNIELITNHDAGNYLCNDLVYQGGRLLAGFDIPFNFLHGPIVQECSVTTQKYCVAGVAQQTDLFKNRWPDLDLTNAAERENIHEQLWDFLRQEKRLLTLSEYVTAVTAIAHAAVNDATG